MLCEMESSKLLIFAHHHAMLNALSEVAVEKNIKFIRIDGQTPSQERQVIITFI